jgi:ferredoxin
MDGAHRLTGQEMLRWVDGLLASGRRVFAPVMRGGVRHFGEIEEAVEVRLDGGLTRWSAKEALFPRSETLFSWKGTSEGVEVAPEPLDPRPQVLLGVPPCDAAAFTRLDAVLAADPAYGARRAATTVVSVVCEDADAACFCTEVGGSPAGEEGCDLQMIRDGDAFVLRPLTGQGQALLAGAPGCTEEDGTRRRTGEARSHWPALAGVAPALEAAFASPAWDPAGARCLGCAACAVVCPSCSCFDVRDEGSAACGARCRSWDACGLALFTVHASGHNPRPTPAARHRQRVLHKFAYFPLRDPEARAMCTGCGRCIRSCPAGIDLRESVRRVLAAGAGGAP